MSIVLVLDEDEAFRGATARVLTGHGYSCIEVGSTIEARAVIEDELDVAVLLCDIGTPTASGVELLSELSSDVPDLAVLITSAVDDSQIAKVAFDLAAFGYLVKPFDANELVVAVAGALRRRDVGSAARKHLRSLEQTIARTRVLGEVVDGVEGTPGSPSDAGEEMIDRLSRAVSLRDEETGRHLQRMSRYSVVLAEAVGFTGLSPGDLRLASALHDVGKIGVPDGILLKPGSLSADENAAMRRHAQIGYQLLAGSTSKLLRVAAELALTHHEWWDGSGYPRGRQGEEIPEAARIAAITDVFDALTSNRVYRPAMPFDKALAIMGELRGRQFEPRLFDALLASMDEIAAIRQEYPDDEDAEDRIRVLVVDDHTIFSQSLVRLLGSRPELKVVGTAGTVEQAVAAALAYLPDVVLMDFELPDGDGPQATEQIKALCPTVKVIMLTSRTDERSLVRAIAAGCAGFVKKEDAVEILFAAIVAAHEDDAVSSPADLASLLQRLRPTSRGVGSDLTRRQIEILELIALGLVNKEIAAQLGLRLNTVRNHVQAILEKLHAHSRLEAVSTAVRERIIGYPPAAASPDGS